MGAGWQTVGNQVSAVSHISVQAKAMVQSDSSEQGGNIYFHSITTPLQEPVGEGFGCARIQMVELQAGKLSVMPKSRFHTCDELH